MLNAALLPSDLQADAPLGIAISGGSDSTALLALLCDQFDPKLLRAVTVDHGLRPGSQDEVAQVAALCAGLGVAHEGVTLNLSPGGDLQARARIARYRALSAWASAQGVRAVTLGHTRDDVAETFLLRLARGSGVDGLAQMPERFSRHGHSFLRPMLQQRRDALRAYLTGRGLGWIDDPSNTDTRFARARMRAAAPLLNDLGLTAERLARTAQWMGAAQEVLETAAESWIASHAHSEHGDAVLAAAALKQAPFETAARVLSRALCGVAAAPYRPRIKALQALRAALDAGKSMTLHGCLAYRQGADIRITREPQAVRTDGLPWDGRWQISGPLTAQMQIRPLGASGLNQLPGWRKTALLPRRSLLASPSIWQADTLIAAPLARPDVVWSASAPNPLHLSK